MEATRRKVADHAEAEELLSQWRISGQALGEFCRALGVDGRSLSCWRLNLARRKAPDKELRLVELKVSPRTARYRIDIDGILIELDDDFRDETLARILKIVSRC